MDDEARAVAAVFNRIYLLVPELMSERGTEPPPLDGNVSQVMFQRIRETFHANPNVTDTTLLRYEVCCVFSFFGLLTTITGFA